jgi:peptide-methionine (S)-S-oxide reductase
MPSPTDAPAGRAEPLLVPERHFVNGAPLRGPWPEGTKTAIFALGCFWGAEKDYWDTPGVVSTAVGYAGGFTPNATYREVCTGKTGHAEAVLVAYDPSKVSYEELLRIFWENHDPTQGFRQGNDVGTQYRSAIYATDDQQLREAVASRNMFQAQLNQAGFGEITTEIAKAPTFYYAEEYHQQYLAKNPNGYCPNHATGVVLPDVVVTPLHYVG